MDLVGELVPAVRRLLGRGLSDAFQRSCVRIGAFQCFGGGLKASLVGGLRIDVHAVLKLGGPDLVLHQRFMNATNAVRPGTFPEILDRVEVEAGRQCLLMEDLRHYASLVDLIFERGLPANALAPVLDKTLAALAAIHETGRRPDALTGIPTTPEPFAARLRAKLTAALEADPALALLWTTPGQVMGTPCPPLGELLDAITTFLQKHANAAPRLLQHGDPHLGNVMVRARGRGWSVRLIDPNPEVGFTDPLYDVGKLYHWAEPVGWAHVAPEVCRSQWRCHPDGWQLDAHHAPVNPAAERRRASLEAWLGNLHRRLAPGEHDDSLRQRLPLAIAAAHVGLAALLQGDAQQTARRFVLAHTLRHLAQWHRSHAKTTR